MTKSAWIAAVLATAASLLPTTSAPPATGSQDGDVDMNAVLAAAVPGEEHERLSSLVGDWDIEMRVAIEPGRPPSVMTGRAKNTMELGGRFLRTEARAGEGAAAAETLVIVGFDRRYERYTYVGFESYGTHYITAEGSYDDATRTITMAGENSDPLLQITSRYDMLIRFIDENEYETAVVFKEPGGVRTRLVEVTYRRR